MRNRKDSDSDTDLHTDSDCIRIRPGDRSRTEHIRLADHKAADRMVAVLTDFVADYIPGSNHIRSDFG